MAMNKQRLAAFAVSASLAASLIPGQLALAQDAPERQAADAASQVAGQAAQMATSKEAQDALSALVEQATSDQSRDMVKGFISTLPPELQAPLLQNFDAGWDAFGELGKVVLTGITSAMAAAQEHGVDSPEFTDSQFSTNQALLTTARKAYEGDEQAQKFFSDPKNQKAIDEYVTVSKVGTGSTSVDADKSDKAGSSKDKGAHSTDKSESASTTSSAKTKSGVTDSASGTTSNSASASATPAQSGSNTDTTGSATSSPASKSTGSGSEPKSSSTKEPERPSRSDNSGASSATSTSKPKETESAKESESQSAKSKGTTTVTTTKTESSESSTAVKEPVKDTSKDAVTATATPAQSTDTSAAPAQDTKDKGEGAKDSKAKVKEDDKAKEEKGSGKFTYDRDKAELKSEDGKTIKMDDVKTPEDAAYRSLKDSERAAFARDKANMSKVNYDANVEEINKKLKTFTEHSGKGFWNSQDVKSTELAREAQEITRMIDRNEEAYKEQDIWFNESGQERPSSEHTYKMKGVNDGDYDNNSDKAEAVKGQLNEQALNSDYNTHNDKDNEKFVEEWEKNRVEGIPQRSLEGSMTSVYAKKYNRDVPKLNEDGVDPSVVKK